MNSLLSIGLVTIIMAGILLDLIPSANAVCCYSAFYCTKPDCAKGKFCLDCERASYYCGVGSCNIFGCNCDGGCRNGDANYWCWNTHFCQSLNTSLVGDEDLARETQTLLELNESELTELVFIIDANKDKQLNKTEFTQLIHNLSPFLHRINIDKEFEKLDSNQNGFISYDEIDMDLF